MSRRRGREQSRAELLEHLRDQVDFLRTSAARFDAGYTSEAKRLATAVRILLRDTRQSKSLLAQLRSAFRWRFFDSVVVPLESISGEGPYHGLMSIRFATTEAGGTVAYEALCQDPTLRPEVRRPFSDWWTRMVMRDAQANTFSRENLIVVVANQDGGAHVDPILDEAYAKLSRAHSLGITFGLEGPEPRQWTENPVPPAIRQIAQEVLWSLEDQGLAIKEYPRAV